MFESDSNSASSERSPLLNLTHAASQKPSVWFQFCHSVDTVCFGKVKEDDVVSLAVKQLCVWFSVMLLLWLVSFVLVMLDVIDHGRFSQERVLLFVPMWLGSAIGLLSVTAVSVRVCRNATLISSERRLYMRRLGTETASLFIDYDSLPLMRRLFCWNLTLGFTFILLIVAQVLFSVWYLYGEVELWHALIPVITLVCAYLGYLYAMAFMSLTSCAFGTLAVFQMMLFVLKCNGQIDTVSWTVALLPLCLILAGACSYTAFIFFKSAEGRYALSFVQKAALAGYTIALLSLSMAVAMTVFNEFEGDLIISPVDAASSDCINNNQYVLCTVAVCAFTLSLVLVLNAEGRALAHSRGFREPLPLSHTKEGWEPTHSSGDVYMLLLGTVEVALRSPAQVSQCGANSSSLPPRSSILHPRGGLPLSERPASPLRRTDQENKDWEGEIELLLRKSSPGDV